jgi:8-oxo-dGTP diphosphatase
MATILEESEKKIINPVPVVRVGVGCLVTSLKHPGCVLVGKRKASHGAGKYAFPGGHLEIGESWMECASREIKEETNLDVENITFFNVTNDPNLGGSPDSPLTNKHYITIFMKSNISETSEILINNEPNKCEGWEYMKWVDIVEISKQNPHLLFEPVIHLIEQLESNNGLSPA